MSGYPSMWFTETPSSPSLSQLLRATLMRDGLAAVGRALAGELAALSQQLHDFGSDDAAEQHHRAAEEVQEALMEVATEYRL